MSELIIENLGIDPGNGFIKIYDGKSDLIIEPCVIARVNNNLNNYASIIEISDNEELIIGNDAIDAGMRTQQVLAKGTKERFINKEFIQLIAAFIAKNYKSTDITIKSSCFGIPNNLYKSIHEEFKELISNKKFIIKINKELKYVNFKKVKIVPQPLGTYISNISNNEENLLIVDIGFGTVDYTYFYKKSIADNFGNNEGVRKLYEQILESIEEKYQGIKINIYDIPKYLKDQKLKFGGEIKCLKWLKSSLLCSYHFKNILEPILERHDSLKAFDKIIFTGGGMNVFTQFITELSLKNVTVLENVQTSNVLGYQKIAGAK